MQGSMGGQKKKGSLLNQHTHKRQEMQQGPTRVKAMAGMFTDSFLREMPSQALCLAPGHSREPADHTDQQSTQGGKEHRVGSSWEESLGWDLMLGYTNCGAPEARGRALTSNGS